MDAKHTPGPWRARGYLNGNGDMWIDCDAWKHRGKILSGADCEKSRDAGRRAKGIGGTLATAHKDGCGEGFSVEANARLIAAAPDLLAACEAACRYDDAIRRRARDGDYDLDPKAAVAEGVDLDALYHEWMTLARAALAKGAAS